MYAGKLSASKINTFKCCQLQYFAKYELKIKDEAGPAAWLGTAVHSVLEQIVKNKKVPDINAICEENKVLKSAQVVKDLVKKTLNNGYLNNAQNIIDVEYKFDIDLNANVSILGYIDRLDIDNDKAIVIDLKTGKKPYTKKELKNNYQAKMYALAVRKNFPKIKDVDVIFWFVRSQERQLIPISSEESKADEQEFIDIYNEIESVKEPVPTKFKFCSYCIYNDKCPLFKPLTGAGLNLKPSF